MPQDPTVAPGCAVSEADVAWRVIQLALEWAAGSTWLGHSSGPIGWID